MNPEFRRYVWLELSPLRLWALPLVLGALVVMVNAFGQKDGVPGIAWEGLRGLGLAVFTVFTVWGAHKASQSVTSEVGAGTWDLQRLAGHRPWELLFGKLFGSTVYDWLGIACGLAVYAFGATHKLSAGAIALDALILVLGAAWLHSTALLASLAMAAGLRATRRPTRGAGQSGLMIGLLLVSLWLGPALFDTLSAGSEAARDVAWWWTMPAPVFAALSLALFIGWTLLGAHRLVRAELQEPVSPVPWVGFLVFLTAYVVPFVPAPVTSQLHGLGTVFLAVGAAVTGGLFLPLLLGERKDVVRVRGLAAAWRRGDARTVWTRVPLWVFNLVGYGLCLAGLAVCALVWRSSELLAVLGITLSVGLFMLRDLGWILAVHLAPNPGRRPDLVVFFFLAVLYGLVPLLFAAFGEAATKPLYLFVPGMPVAQAAKESAGALVLPALWAVPGFVVAWLLLAPRLARAIGRAPSDGAATPG